MARRYQLESSPKSFPRVCGAVRLALGLVESDVLLVMNGDSYVEVALDSYIDWYFMADRGAGLVLAEVADTGRYGRVCLGADSRIEVFEEKGGNSGRGWINAGLYLINKSLLTSIPCHMAYSLEKRFFPALTGGGLFGFCSKGRFIDIGTLESYAKAERFFAGTAG